MNKQDFISMLTKYDRNEIQKFIEKNGKKPKLIRIFIPIKELKED